MRFTAQPFSSQALAQQNGCNSPERVDQERADGGIFLDQ